MTLGRIAVAALESSVRRHVDHLFDVYFTSTDDRAIEYLMNGLRLTAEKHETARGALEGDET